MELKGTPTKGLISTTLGFFFGFAAVALYGPTAKFFKEAMELSASMVGLLVAMPALSGSLLRIPFGAWVETTGGKKPFMILLLLSLIGLSGVTFILFFTYPDGMNYNLYPIILFFGFLSGCGIATFSVGIGQTSYWFSKNKQGYALGIYAGLGNLAPGLFSMIIPIVLVGSGLVDVYFYWFIFLLIGSVIYFVISDNAYFFQLKKNGYEKDEAIKISKEKGQELFPTESAIGSLKTAGVNWKTWALVGIYFTTFGGFIALTAWFPTYWTDNFHLAIIMAGTLTAVYSLLASAIRVLGGKWSDKYGGENVGIFSISIMLIGAIILTLGLSYSVSLIGTILMAIGMGVANAAVFKLVPSYVPEAVGGAAGLVGGLGAFGGFAVPPLMGLFVSLQGENGFSNGFLVFIILAIISLALFLLLRSKSYTNEKVIALENN
jgi:NNP family nitrate/nitrite transporter-like MFS transporter